MYLPTTELYNWAKEGHQRLIHEAQVDGICRRQLQQRLANSAQRLGKLFIHWRRWRWVDAACFEPCSDCIGASLASLEMRNQPSR